MYSIRSSNQEVIYHISEKRGEKQKDVNNKSTADKAKKMFALAKFQSASPKGSSKGERSARGGGGGPGDLTSIPFLVNPFALVPPDIEEFNFYTKGYPPPAHFPPSPSTTSTSSSVTTSIASSVDASFETDEAKEALTQLQTKTMMEEILSDILSEAMARSFSRMEEGEDETDSLEPTFVPRSERDSRSSTSGRSLNIHPLHSHLLLYTQVCDSRQVLYTMQCIKNILLTNPRLSLCTLSTTKLNASSGGSPRAGQLHTLLARHRKSVFGKNFAGVLNADNMATYRNANLIEVLVSTLLYFLRSYYPNLANLRLTSEEILGNREVQLISIDILSVIVSELVQVTRRWKYLVLWAQNTSYLTTATKTLTSQLFQNVNWTLRYAPSRWFRTTTSPMPRTYRISFHAARYCWEVFIHI